MYDIFDLIGDEKNSDQSKTNKQNTQIANNKDIKNDSTNLFSVESLIYNLKCSSIKNKFNRLIHSNSITAYDIASTCIRQTIYRLLNYPMKSYEDIWLPVLMRQNIGNSIHNFIQSNYKFDQIEVVVKIDKFNFSGRIDAVNGNNVLIEIKSVSFNDYEKIIKNNKPREKDLKQTLIYKYLLENYIDEINKTKTEIDPDGVKYNWPKHNYYNINYIQFIYVAHDLISSEADTIQETLMLLKQMKKQLNSANNKFFFIKEITIDVNGNKDELVKIENELFDKLNRINYYLKRNKLPPLNDKYIYKTSCYFCPYKELC